MSRQDTNVTAQLNSGTSAMENKEITSIRNTKVYENGGAFFFVDNVEEKLPPGTYSIQRRNGTVCFVPENVQTDGIIVLEHSLQSTILSDIKKFWTKGEIYKKFDILHKRGYLVHGPQGSGKTGVIYQLCDAIKEVGGFSVMVDTPDVDGPAIRRLREVEPDRPILGIIEEIDMQISEYDEAEWASLLDGEYSVNNIIWVATTNNIEKLHPRFRNRPSRFDMVVEVGMPTKNDRARYVAHKFSNVSAELLNKISIDTEGFSLAHLKELLVSTECLEVPYDDALSRLKIMIETEAKEAKG
jgi:hypothetical protein